jgi:hypothetical protein
MTVLFRPDTRKFSFSGQAAKIILMKYSVETARIHAINAKKTGNYGMLVVLRNFPAPVTFL